MDRAPAHEDYEPAVYCLRDLRNAIGVQDTWRLENPTTRMYTFASNANSLSRLDQIYARPQLTNSLYHWDVATTSIPSDHKMVLVRLKPPKTPYVSRGRWTWPLGLLFNDPLIQHIISLGIELQSSLEHPPVAPPGPSAQQKWSSFKKQMTDLAKQSAKTHLAKMDSHINTLKKNIALAEQDPLLNEQEAMRSKVIALENELKQLQRKRYKNACAKAQAQWHDKGEKISKYWSTINTPKRPRDIIYSLCDPLTETLSTKSSEMAEIA